MSHVWFLALLLAWEGVRAEAPVPPEHKAALAQKVERASPPAPAAEHPDGGTAAPPAARPDKRERKDEPRRPSVPLAPTPADLERLRAAQKGPELGAGHGTVRVLRRPVPTSTGNTAGPGASQGAGTAQDRKAATMEAGGPTHGVRR